MQFSRTTSIFRNYWWRPELMSMQNIKVILYFLRPPYLAVQSNNIDISRLLVKAGAHLNLKYSNDATLLHLAVKSNNVIISKILVEAGADVNAKDKHNITPLLLSVRSNNMKITRLLVNAGADTEATDLFGNFTPLETAIETKNVTLLKLFLSVISDVNEITDLLGFTLLHRAAAWGNSQVVKVLLDAGAEVNVTKNADDTPLHKAASSANFYIVKMLVAAGADMNATNSAGQTPLHLAVMERSLRIVKFLLNSGANVNAVDNSGNTVLHKATYYKYMSNVSGDDGITMLPPCPLILNELIKSGATVNSCNADGETPLTSLFNRVMISSTGKDRNLIQKCVRLLIKYTDINISFETGKNQLHDKLENWYVMRHRHTISEIIIEHISKLKMLDLHVDSGLLNFISLKSDLWMNKYFTECMQELKKMKSTRLENCWVTFFNLAVDNESKFVKYAGNKDLLKDFEKRVEMFPIYGVSMQENLLKGVENRKLFDDAALNLSYHLPIFDPFHLIIRNTLDSLNEQDWKNLCEPKRCRE